MVQMINVNNNHCKMSQQNSSELCSKPPKKFLKKGEGLKRFAAYKPPLPVITTNKVQRRQTFVKFKLDGKLKKDSQSNFFLPELLENDSINLSMEVPKIAPPKIMHTPVRPNRQALGSLKPSNFNCFEDIREDNEIMGPPPPPPPQALKQHPIPFNPSRNYEEKILKESTDIPKEKERITSELLHDKNLTRKVASIQSTQNKRISFDGVRKNETPSPTSQSPVAQMNEQNSRKPQQHSQKQETARQSDVTTDQTQPPKRYNLRGSRRQNAESAPEPQIKLAPKTRRQIKAVVERHIAPPPDDTPILSESMINGNIDNLLEKIEEKKTSLDEARSNDEEEDLTPCETKITKSSGQHFKQKVAFDLSNPTPGNCLLALGQRIQQIESTVNELREKIRNCKCGADMFTPKQAPQSRSTRQASKSKTNNARPSANADNPTPKLFDSLINEIAQLRDSYEEMNLRR